MIPAGMRTAIGAVLGMVAAAIVGVPAKSQSAPIPLFLLNPIVISAKAQTGIYPERARAAHESGSAVVRCTGKSGARLSGCVVADEDPTDADFGSTALAIATHLNASHIPVDSSHEAAVVVWVDFQYPDAPPPRPPVPKNGWTRQPTSSDLSLYYPDHGLSMGQDGWALLRCTVGAQGELWQCKVAAEAPTGFGFGNAALKLSGDYRMRAEAGLAGKTINIPLNFRLPKPDH